MAANKHEAEILLSRWLKVKQRAACIRIELEALVKEERKLRCALQIHIEGTDRNPSLSRRLKEVLPLLHSHKSNKEIGSSLNISERTVKYHVGELLRRFKVSSREQIVTATPWVSEELPS